MRSRNANPKITERRRGGRRASGAKGRALRGEIASRSAVDWLGRPTNGDYRALRNSGWRKDGNLVDRRMVDGYLERREGADRRTNGRADGADERRARTGRTADERMNGRMDERTARTGRTADERMSERGGLTGLPESQAAGRMPGSVRQHAGPVVRTAKISGTARPRSVVRPGQDQWYR